MYVPGCEVPEVWGQYPMYKVYELFGGSCPRCPEVSELLRILSPVCEVFEIFGYVPQHVQSLSKTKGHWLTFRLRGDKNKYIYLKHHLIVICSIPWHV